MPLSRTPGQPKPFHGGISQYEARRRETGHELLDALATCAHGQVPIGSQPLTPDANRESC
jgi:hypothetical protein